MNAPMPLNLRLTPFELLFLFRPHAVRSSSTIQSILYHIFWLVRAIIDRKQSETPVEMISLSKNTNRNTCKNILALSKNTNKNTCKHILSITVFQQSLDLIHPTSHRQAKTLDPTEPPGSLLWLWSFPKILCGFLWAAKKGEDCAYLV